MPRRRARPPRRAIPSASTPASAATAWAIAAAGLSDQAENTTTTGRSGSSRNRRATAADEERGLADAARPVEDGQPRGDDVRADDLDVLLAPEEQHRVDRRVRERSEPLVGRAWQLPAHVLSIPSSRPSSRLAKAFSSTSTAWTSRRRQNASSSAEGEAHTAQEAYGRRTLAAEPGRHEPEVPVGEVVAEEEEVASSQPGVEDDRDHGLEVAGARVVDVVVLGHDEALPGAVGAGVGQAPKAEEYRPPLQREVCVGVRHVHRARLGSRRRVEEPAAQRPLGDVGDDVQLLARVGERALDAAVERGRHDDLVRSAALAQETGKTGQQPMNRRAAPRRPRTWHGARRATVRAPASQPRTA